jgi:hypothetical protein
MSDVSRRVGALERAVGVSTGGAWCECERATRVRVVWTDDEAAAIEAEAAAAPVCERCGRPVLWTVVHVEYGDEAEVLDES